MKSKPQLKTKKRKLLMVPGARAHTPRITDMAVMDNKEADLAMVTLAAAVVLGVPVLDLLVSNNFYATYDIIQ